MTLLSNLWWLLVLIGVMILVHELGHFWAARAFDVKVDVFSFGFGPRLFGFRRGDTDYRFSLFLFGGYVKMVGDQPGDAQAPTIPGIPCQTALAAPDHRSSRVPFMNVVLAVAVLTGLYMVSYEKIIDDNGGDRPRDAPTLRPPKPAFRPGDKIVRLNGKDNPDWEDISPREMGSVGGP
jgi:regulator of sigma E protease